jgi:hypothetical protein
MTTWYEASDWWDSTIKEVEIDRETASSVFIKGRRTAKKSEYAAYFSTWEGAHAYLLGKAEMKVESARVTLQQAHDKLGNVKGMKKP